MNGKLKIPVGKFMLMSDEHNWIVAKPVTSKKTGKESLTGFKYFSDLQQAIRHITEQSLRESEATTMEQLALNVAVITGAMVELHQELSK